MLNGHVRPQTTKVLRFSAKLPATSSLSQAKNTYPLTRPLQHCSPPKIPSGPSNFGSRRLSDLGLRSHKPPDVMPDSNEPSQSPEVGDQEWEIRTGRALYVIQETLPDFFQRGLITSVDKATGLPSQSKATFPSASTINILESHFINNEAEPIYSPNIRMQYTPPAELPPPFPKTFHIEGLQLYLGSSGIIRHTMNALYSDLTIKTTKVVIKSPPALPSASTGGKRRINRDKSFVVRQIVTGIARVSGKPSEWEIESTYSFSPITGLIYQHVVDSIQPAPHVAVYDSLRSSLGKLLGWAQGPPTAPNGAICRGQSTNHAVGPSVNIS